MTKSPCTLAFILIIKKYVNNKNKLVIRLPLYQQSVLMSNILLYLNLFCGDHLLIILNNCKCLSV